MAKNKQPDLPAASLQAGRREGGQVEMLFTRTALHAAHTAQT